MQALVLQLGRFGFLLLLWFFIWLILHSLKNDTLAASFDLAATNRKPRKGKNRSWKNAFKRPRRGSGGKVARYLMVTQGPLAGARITLGVNPFCWAAQTTPRWSSTTTTPPATTLASSPAEKTGTWRTSVPPTERSLTTIASPPP